MPTPSKTVPPLWLLEHDVQAAMKNFCMSEKDARADVARDYGFKWDELLEHVQQHGLGQQHPPAVRGQFSFEVTLPRNADFRALVNAGMLASTYRELANKVFGELKVPRAAPAHLSQAICLYLQEEQWFPVRVTILQYGLPTDLRIETDHPAVHKKLSTFLKDFEQKHQCNIQTEHDHTALWATIDKILASDGITYDDLRFQKTTLTTRALNELIALCDTLSPNLQDNIHVVVTRCAKSEKLRVGQWLLQQLRKPHADDQLGMRIWDIVTPALADDLIAALHDKRLGGRRATLALALADTKDKRAPDAIAPLLEESASAQAAIQALGKLRATQHAPAIRKHLQSKDPEIRTDARKALKRMGLGEKSTEPLHLVKNKKLIPKGLEEWSQNLDGRQLEPALKQFSKRVDSGFGPVEIAEVLAVADDMNVDQTCVFHFHIIHKGAPAELWLTLFMDDINTPDLALSSTPALIKQFTPKLK